MARGKFGVSQFSKHPPKWLVPAFSISIVLIGVISFTVTGDPALTNEFKVRFNHYLTALTMLLSGLAPLFGVDTVKKEEQDDHLGI